MPMDWYKFWQLKQYDFLFEFDKRNWIVWTKVGLRGVQHVAKGRKQLDRWKISYTESKAVKTSPVNLAPMAWGKVACRWVPQGWMSQLGALKCYTKRQGQRQGPLQYNKKALGLNFRKNQYPEWICHCSLQKTGRQNLAWNWMAFMMKPQQGMGKPFAPLRRGPNGLLMAMWGTMLNVASVSTKYLSLVISSVGSVSTKYSALVISSVRNIRPELGGKCMAVIVACVDVAATEPKGAQQHFSFFSRWKGPPTHSGPFLRRNCGTYACHCWGFLICERKMGKKGDFSTGHYRPSYHLSSP